MKTKKRTIVNRSVEYDITISDRQGYVIAEHHMLPTDIIIAVNKLICKMQQIDYREDKDVEVLEKEVIRKLNDVFDIEDGMYDTKL